MGYVYVDVQVFVLVNYVTGGGEASLFKLEEMRSTYASKFNIQNGIIEI